VFTLGFAIENIKLVFANQCLVECTAKELDSFLAIIHFIPITNVDFHNPEFIYSHLDYRAQKRGTGAAETSKDIALFTLQQIQNSSDGYKGLVRHSPLWSKNEWWD
jgi:hypothetical protein